MTLAPFYAAPVFIKVHIIAALTVASLTPLQFWGFRKGSLPHRASGYLWLGAMLVVAISSFWIRASGLEPRLGPFSFIHLLSVLALFSIYTAIRHARAGNIIGHRKTLIALSIGFWIAGVLTFTPDRIMGQIIGL
ncbi:MAG: hypothetical protein CFE31_00375 [Rhizobiales bacterium PAR1]|nr:MAG: hypothetical protein CFE31_00375 [Rhizobiales bacterium PAR1]